jgi:hypothetical protein
MNSPITISVSRVLSTCASFSSRISAPVIPYSSSSAAASVPGSQIASAERAACGIAVVRRREYGPAGGALGRFRDDPAVSGAPVQGSPVCRAREDPAALAAVAGRFDVRKRATAAPRVMTVERTTDNGHRNRLHPSISFSFTPHDRTAVHPCF